MSFVDELYLKVCSGNGGPGCISFASSRRRPMGGPDGGDGGDGGAVIIQTSSILSSLSHLNVHYQAEAGRPGRSQKQKGSKGRNLILEVPPHTWMTIDRQTVEIKEPYTLLKGGRGGKGNFFFKTSVNKAPRKSTPGKKGRSKQIHLETKIQADIALIGWKSIVSKEVHHFLNQKHSSSHCLFSQKSPYTRQALSRYSVIELPKLKLTQSFLRHALSSKILLFLLNLKNSQQCIEEYKKIIHSLRQFNSDLLKKQQAWLVIQDPPPSQDEFQKTKNFFIDNNLNIFSKIKSLEKFIEKHTS